MSDYDPVGWNASTPISAKNFNNMETIYAHLKTHIDAHDHDGLHYPESVADTTFFFSGNETNLDADMIDGQHAATLLGADVPLGLTLLHAGSDDDFSNGYLIADNRWHIADGGEYNGIKTPDMRGYFPKCPTTSSTTGTGGSATVTLSGTVTFGDHTLTVAEIPSHYHRFTDRYYYDDWNAYSSGYSMISPNTSNVGRTTNYNHTGEDQPHNHGTKDINLNSVQLTPPWIALYFITRVA